MLNFFKNLNIAKSLIFLFFLNCILFYIFQGAAGLFLSDYSREVYIPYSMNLGNVLYKDILNVYSPLGYQINAFALYIFGNKLAVFYFLGFINALLFTSGIFLTARLLLKEILKNSREKFSFYVNAFALNITFFIMVSCCYTVSLTNYITPYSYSLVYALTAFVWSILALLYFLKNNSYKYLIGAFFLFGISLDCKYEFIPFALVLAFFLAKERNLRLALFSLLAFLVVPMLSFCDLLLKGVDFTVLNDSIQKIILLSKAPSVKILYTYLGFIPNINSFKNLIFSFVKTSLISGAFLGLIAFCLKSADKKVKAACCTVLLLLIAVFSYQLYRSNSFYFNWIGLSVLIILPFFAYLLYQKKLKNLLPNADTMLFITCFSAVLGALKCIFDISFNSYGTYFFPLLFVCLVLFFVWKKSLQNKISKNYIISIFCLILVFSLGFLSSNYFRKINVFPAYFTNEKGSFYSEAIFVKPASDLVNYISSNTKKEDTVLVLPEGAMINFLSERKSNDKYYYLIPPNIEVFGESAIAEDLENNLPNYIVLQSMSYTNFNETYFCESFGRQICELLPKYYENPIVFGNDFWFALYKLK